MFNLASSNISATATAIHRPRDIALVLGMSVSALSHQLRFLRERGAVERRKGGRIVYYRLVDNHLRDLVLGAATHVSEGA